MNRKAMMSAMGLAAGVTLALVLMLASGGSTGEYHVANTLICYDCHTIHYSMQHGWDGGPVGTVPVPGGNWLAPGGPNTFLLKAPANTLCLQCHDGSAAAPDVVELNANASPSQGRQAGAVNKETGAAPYETWKGHTLDSTVVPPGYNPTAAGFSATVYTASNGLECVSCHTQHGRAPAYRNLGPRSLASGTFTVSYHISTTNDTTKDVWVNQTPAPTTGPGSPGSRTAAEWNPYYDRANVFYNRHDSTIGTLKSSNNIDVHCSACHANFHGGPGDTSVGGVPTGASGSEFTRHPTAQVNIGDLSSGHSSLPNYAGGLTKVKVYTMDYAGYTNSSPGCVSCHKAHGNQNPFGLIFLGQQATSVDDQGGWNAGQAQTLQEGLRNLCGQCHTQGN